MDIQKCDKIIDAWRRNELQGPLVSELLNGEVVSNLNPHMPVTNLCRLLRQHAPGEMKLSIAYELPNYLAHVLSLPAPGGDPLDVLTALQNVGNSRVAVAVKNMETSVIRHLSALASRTGDAKECLRRSDFMYRRLDALAGAMAYRYMDQKDRLRTIYTLSLLGSGRTHSWSKNSLATRIHAALLVTDNKNLELYRYPVDLWRERMGSVAAVFEYCHYQQYEPLDIDTALLYWTELAGGDRYSISPAAPVREVNGYAYIDWTPLKDQWSLFDYDYAQAMREINAFNSCNENALMVAGYVGDLEEVRQALS